ncbi:MAG: hypothetical protein WCE90_00945 [Candidatus Zixiibacteriota bacterium]
MSKPKTAVRDSTSGIRDQLFFVDHAKIFAEHVVKLVYHRGAFKRRSGWS